MIVFSKLTLFGCLLAIVGASPVNILASDPEARDLRERDDIEPIREAYRGIHWDDALAQCTHDEFLILVESTRMALDLVNYVNTGSQWWDSPA